MSESATSYSAIHCNTCGRPTGEVASVEELEKGLPPERQICSNCSPFAAQPGRRRMSISSATLEQDAAPVEEWRGYACQNCGSGSFYMSERMTRNNFGSIETNNDNPDNRVFIVSESDEPEGAGITYEAHCRDCNTSIEFSDAEWE